MNAKFCTSCGKKLEEGMKFCVACGTPVAGADSVADDADSGAEEALASLAPEANEAPAADADATTVAPAAGEEGAATAEPEPTAQPVAEPATTTLLETPAQPTVVSQPATAQTQPQPQAYIPPTQPTQQFPTAQPTSATAPTAAYVDETATATPAGAKSEPNRVFIGIIAALVGILIAVGVIFIVKPFDTASTGDQTTASESSDSESSKDDDAEETEEADDEEAEDTEEEDQTETVDETANYNNLTAFYNQLSGLDSEVRTVATNFNAHYLDSSYTTRKSYADAASNLSSRISSLKSQVQALNISSSSKYYSNWQDTITLYDDLLQRISVMCDAWDIDLSSSDPASNKTAILAPISRDNVEGTNDNKYRLDYEQRYASAQPQQ